MIFIIYAYYCNEFYYNIIISIIVVIIRSWHPDLSDAEINGLTFIFDFLNFAAIGDYELNKFEYEYLNNINNNHHNTNNKKIDNNNINNNNRKDTRGPTGFHRGH